MDNKKFKIGDEVWIYDNNLCECVDHVRITSELQKEDNYFYYKFHSIENRWDAGALVENIFKTKKEAKAFAEKKKKERYDEVASNINSVEDLIRSAYSLIDFSEFPDWNAIKAVEDKAKELLNIDLRK